jgi:hypothetical protein
VRRNGIPKATVARTSMAAFAPTRVRERKILQRHERGFLARFHRREDGEEHDGAGEETDRLRRTPTGLGRLDERVDEQEKRTRDGERAERVVPATDASSSSLRRRTGQSASASRPNGMFRCAGLLQSPLTGSNVDPSLLSRRSRCIEEA